MTIQVGFHASHEQFDPRTLLSIVEHADQAGFRAAMSSDHFAPWSARQGESGFAWAWLGSALQATGMTFGVVTAPGQRYHPAITAQAIATLAEMYPGRFWAALGSGQAMNEHITGDPWPEKPVRTKRLRESAEVIRSLLQGNEGTIDSLVRVDRATLWSRPAAPPQLFAAAISAESAAHCAEWADGLITVNQPEAELRETIAAYRDAGGSGSVMVQLHVSLAASENEARMIAHDQWRENAIGPPDAWNIELPEEFERASQFLDPDELDETVLITDDAERIADQVNAYATLGVDAVYLHHVGTDQRPFIDAMATHVLPNFRKAI